MTTVTEDSHYSYSNNCSLPTTTLSSDSQHPQEVSVSELIDHGSISFGRFAGESLAWEKWSVFSHNKCQEELEKFKAPGLVAQKKAYFEEYYKRIRAMKKLQEEQNEANGSDPSHEEPIPTTQAEKGVDINKADENDKHIDAVQIKNSENETVIRRDLPGKIRKDESFVNKQQSNKQSDTLWMRGNVNISLQTIDQKHFAHKAAPKPAPSVEECSKTIHQDNLVSDAVTANKLKDCASPLKAEGKTSLAVNKKKLDCRTKKAVARSAEKPKPFIHKDFAGKGDYLSKRTPKATSNIKSAKVASDRSFTEIRSSGAPSRSSVLKDKLASSTTSMRGSVTEANFNSRGLADKSTLKDINSTAAVKNIDLEKRRTRAGIAGKSLELSTIHSIPKRGQSENQNPISMSTQLAPRNKSNKSLGTESDRGNNVTEAKQKQVRNANVGRVPKSSSTMMSSNQKASNLKREQKIARSQSADLTRAQRNSRNKMPSWR